MQTCPDTTDMIGNIPPTPADPSILFDLAERTGVQTMASNNSDPAEGESAKRRSPEQIQADLEAQYRADLERLNQRYANKIGGAASRVKPVGERRKEALAKMDAMRAIVRRTNPVMEEAGIDALILGVVTKEYADLADRAMPACLTSPPKETP